MKGVKQTHPVQPNDPLFVIFEQHLYNIPDANLDRKDFIGLVLKDYIAYLRKFNITIPKPLEAATFEELANQINTMLVKKIYGSLSIQEYQKGLAPAVKKQAKTRYSKLKK